MEANHTQEYEFTPEQKQTIEKEKDYYTKLIDKSNEYFEKQLIYVSAGTLTASVFIIEKFFSHPSVHSYWAVFISWIFCGGSILLNLVSHYLSIKVYRWVHSKLPAETEDQAEQIEARKGKVASINFYSLAVYFLGLLFFMIFIGININYMNKKETPNLEKRSWEATKVQVVKPVPKSQPAQQSTNAQQSNNVLNNPTNNNNSN